VVGADLNRAVFLDRDGVLNQSSMVNGKPYAPLKLADFKILPGVRESLNSLKKEGFKLVLVTNQPDLSTGRQTEAGLRQIHDYLCSQCPIDLVKVCGHTDADQCKCRKPSPGMLLEAANELNIVLGKSFMVGDRWRDVEAGQRAGCQEVFFIDYDYDEQRPSGSYKSVKSLRECANQILEIK